MKSHRLFLVTWAQRDSVGRRQRQVIVTGSLCWSKDSIGSPWRSDQVSIIDDLAFAMYQDPEIAAIIRNLDRKKQECVHGREPFRASIRSWTSGFFRRKIRPSSKIQTGDSRADQSNRSQSLFARGCRCCSLDWWTSRSVRSRKAASNWSKSSVGDPFFWTMIFLV